jgi:hypothetical protein
MEGLVRLGIGPFQVYTFTSETVTEQTYRGESSPFSLTVCFATNDDLTFRIMQPLSGARSCANSSTNMAKASTTSPSTATVYRVSSV